jgi:hypothetical protein
MTTVFKCLTFNSLFTQLNEIASEFASLKNFSNLYFFIYATLYLIALTLNLANERETETRDIDEIAGYRKERKERETDGRTDGRTDRRTDGQTEMEGG